MTINQSLFLLLLLTIPAVLLHRTYREKRWFQQHGFAATGTVLKLVEEDDGESSIFYPVVRFPTEEHGWIVAVYDVGNTQPRYRVNQSVQLLFDPQNPRKFTLETGPFGIDDWWPYAFVVGMICVGYYISINQLWPF